MSGPLYNADIASSSEFEGLRGRSTQRTEGSTLPTTSCTFRGRRAYSESSLTSSQSTSTFMPTSGLYEAHRTRISAPGPIRPGQPSARTNHRNTSELRVTPASHMLSPRLLLMLSHIPLLLLSRPHSLHISIYDRLPRCSRPVMRTGNASY